MSITNLVLVIFSVISCGCTYVYVVVDVEVNKITTNDCY